MMELQRYRTNKAYYERIKALTEEMRTMRHDFRFQLSSLGQMLRNMQYGEALDFLYKIYGLIAQGSNVTFFSEDPVVQAMLDRLDGRCKKEGIKFTSQIGIRIEEQDEYELSIVLGNLMNNALAACLKTPAGRPRYISLMIQRMPNGGTVIVMKNSYDGVSIRARAGRLLSTRVGGGLGTESVKSLVARRGGEFTWDYDEQEFRAYVTTPPHPQAD
jgi:sensor histidine kinase regulating citrate/malate metabolism